jgi:hypothetical protein
VIYTKCHGIETHTTTQEEAKPQINQEKEETLFETKNQNVMKMAFTV